MSVITGNYLFCATFIMNDFCLDFNIQTFKHSNIQNTVTESSLKPSIAIWVDTNKQKVLTAEELTLELKTLNCYLGRYKQTNKQYSHLTFRHTPDMLMSRWSSAVVLMEPTLTLRISISFMSSCSSSSSSSCSSISGGISLARGTTMSEA